MSSLGLFIPENTEQKGDLHVEGDVRIEGNFVGNLYSEFRLTIGKKAYVAGEIECQQAYIMGVFSGTLRVHQECTLYKTAKFQGLLDSPTAKIEKGCQFRGEVFITGQASP